LNRTIIYSEEQARDFDVMWGWKDTLYAAAFLQQDMAGGTTSVVSGLAATPTSPATLSINLTSGRIYQQAALDSTSYGSLPSDSTLVMQQGFAVAQAVALTTSALSAGQSQWALIQAAFSQSDIIRAGDPTNGVLYYWNSANPTQPFQGPGNTGAANNTERAAVCTVSVVYGSPATTGSEVPPTPASGQVPLYLVDLTFGQTQITSGQIKVAGPSVGTGVPSNYLAAPFLAGLLFQHHKGTPGQAPQIDLTAEVKNTLPLTNLPGSDTVGGIPVMKLNAGNPNGSVAGNASVNGASDFAFDTTNKILYVCTVTGTTSTAVWTAVVGSTSSQFAGVTTTGTANAQAVTSTTPSGFSLTSGYVVTTTIGAGLNNSAASTLNVDATGNIAINKVSGGSNVPLAGGELVAGQFVSFIYTGAVWLLQASALGALATLNIGAWLKNDGAGNLTVKNGLTLGDDGAGNLTILAGTVTPAMLDASAAKQRPLVQALPSQGAGNLTLSNDGTSPNFVVDIAAGRVSDDSDLTLIQLAAAMTKRLDQSWAPGTGNGACDTSTKGNNQTWHAYAIGRTGMTVTNVARTSNVASLTVAAHNLGIGSTVRVLGCGLGLDGLQVVTAVTTNTFNYANAGSNITSQAAAATAIASGFDVLFSQSYPTPTLPSGYNVRQCLGSVLTGSSGNILPFSQWGDLFYWSAPTTDVSPGTPNGVYGVKVPLNVQVEAIFNAAFLLSTGLAANLYIYTPGTTAPPVAMAACQNTTGTTLDTATQGRALTNTSGQLAIVATSATSFLLSTLGWRDLRRRLF
jgi:hypothetical protein